MRKLETHTQAEMFDHIETCRQSRLSYRAYSLQHNIAYSTFLYWVKKYIKERELNSTANPSSGFIPVKLQSYPDTNKINSPGQLHFLMPNGVQVVCPETIQPQVLRTLLNS